MPIDTAAPDLEAIAAAFDAEHARTYGHASPGAPTDLVSLKAIGRALAGRDVSMHVQGGGRMRCGDQPYRRVVPISAPPPAIVTPRN